MSNKVLATILVFSVLFNLFLGYSLMSQDNGDIQGFVVQQNGDPEEFNLISPKIAQLDAQQFLNNQKKYVISYHYLRPQLEQIIHSNNHAGIYGVYVEDFTTGAWMGINERDRFLPRSLLKTPLMIAILQKVNRNEVSLNDVVTITSEDVNALSGPLASKGPGKTYTVGELLSFMVQDSDNTATRALYKRFISPQDSYDSMRAVGLPIIEGEAVDISPKEYANMMRSLYYSYALPRPLSEFALSLMLNTSYNSELPAGLPKGINIAHKVGFDYESSYYHDCGIVYLPERPYFICVMSRNNTQKEADETISAISREVYNFMNERE